MFYPQLVAGPIERPQNLLPQFHTKHLFDYDRVTSGLKLIAYGMFKKCVIADRLAVIVNTAYGSPYEFAGPQLALATAAFAFQIYCDFSGYSDIALGTAEVMGFRLMVNFKRPYFSRSISEFWRRWHISLSTWFKDYVYVPLGGNRVSLPRRCLNLMLVFTISGLWHGANWTFVIWGAIHGAYLVSAVLLARLTGGGAAPERERPPVLRDLPRILGVFVLVDLGWIFFRANSVREAFYILSSLPTGWGTSWSLAGLRTSMTQLGMTGSQWLTVGCAVALLLGIEALQTRMSVRSWLSRCPFWVRWPVYYAAIFCIIRYGRFGHEQFIYFQF